MVTSSKPDKVKPPVYHHLELARGWRVLRQHVKLDVDLSARTLRGTASLTLSVLNQNCCKLALNLRRCTVSSVRVNSVPCAYQILSPLDDQPFLNEVSSRTQRHRIRDIQFSANNRDEQSRRCGELLISIPASSSADQLDELSRLNTATKPDPKSEPNPNDDSALPPPPVPVYDLPILHIQIDYKVLDPNMGAIFYGNQADQTKVRDPVYMLTDSRFGMARFWMPCVDSSYWCDRYLFDFDITVDSKYLVVASGELAETLCLQDSPHVPSKKTFRYHAHAPAHASEIVVAIGAFIALPDPILDSTITHFCLPGHAHELVYTAPPLLAKALSYCREFFGSDPPSSSFKQLFLGSSGLRPETSVVGAGGIVVHSADLLHTERCIDEAIAAREAVMNAVVISYLGRFLRPRVAEDGWLISGLASHVTSRGLESMLGTNWYKYRVHDLMEQLRTERSCDLSNTKIDLASDSMMESLRRRSHVIMYMVERRIGRDVMERSLRDIVAEGKRALLTLVKNVDLASRKPVYIDIIGERNMTAPWLPPHRKLTDLQGNACSENAPSGAVSSGFDEVVQGVGVGPFLKRLRAICGTDVRSMVRNWASSPGIPRMQVGYQYNPRKHTIEFVVKQQVPAKGSLASNQPSLLLGGAVNIRVMEAEGTYDHTLEISDPIFGTEVPCHSRRSKVVKGSGAEEINNNVVTQASPLSWIRFDPENEWCKEVTFTQHESSWASLLEGERDVIGQAEACKGLRGFSSDQSAKSLLAVLKDGQFYWRVRAEAASVLANSADGLKLLIRYFRTCYTDGESAESGNLRPNNFSNIANYFVKRAMLRALAAARLKGSCTATRRDGSVPLEASQFLCFVLAGHDNAGNDFDDDYYVSDLLEAVTDVAVACIGDELHEKGGVGGFSTTECIVRQLERFKSIERMIQRRTVLVASGIVKGLCRIERARLIHEDRKGGKISSALRRGLYKPKEGLLLGLFDMIRRTCTFEARISAFSCLADTYGGLLDVALWGLTYVDQTSSCDDIVDLRHKVAKSESEDDDTSLEGVEYDFSEAPLFRYRFLEALCEAASCKEWFHGTSPLLSALRSDSQKAIDFCIRLLRLIVADGDARVRGYALRLAKMAWGLGIPCCLLSNSDYIAMRNGAGRLNGEAKEVVAMRSHGAGVGIATDAAVAVASPKGCKSGKSKGVKNGKTSKANKKPEVLIIEPSGDRPPKPPSKGAKSGKSVHKTVILNDVPILSTEPLGGRSRGTASAPRSLSSRPKSPVLPVLPAVDDSGSGGRMRKTVGPSRRGSGHTEPFRSSKGGAERMVDKKCVNDLYGRKSGYESSGFDKRNTRIEEAFISEPVTQEDEVVAVEDVDSWRAKPVVKNDRGSGSMSMRSMGRGSSGSGIGDIPFLWHPMDKEDGELFRKVVEGRKRERDRGPSGKGSERSKGERGSRGGSRRDEGNEGRNIVVIDSNGVKAFNEGDDDEAEDEDIDGEGRIMSTGTENGNGNEDEGDRKKKKKKKKKKRKREHDGDDDEHRKKKKKKRKKRDSDGYEDSEHRGRSSISDSVNGEESKKIGKIQIRLPSRNSASHQLSSSGQ